MSVPLIRPSSSHVALSPSQSPPPHTHVRRVSFSPNAIGGVVDGSSEMLGGTLCRDAVEYVKIRGRRAHRWRVEVRILDR